MQGLIERGYVYIAQPPLYRIKRKRREQYIENDEEMNRILLELGSEDVTLTRRARRPRLRPRRRSTRSSRPSPQLERLGAGVTRYGVDLADYLDRHHAGDAFTLPKYIARIREGNQETHEFLADDAARSAFYLREGIDADLLRPAGIRGQRQRRPAGPRASRCTRFSRAPRCRSCCRRWGASASTSSNSVAPRNPAT